MSQTEKIKTEKRLWILFKVFFKISAFSVGGGLTMLPLMEKEFVEKRHWITETEMVDVVAIVQSLPGLIAVNMAILVGQRSAGFAGAMVASIGVVIPPVVVIILIAAFLLQLSGKTMDQFFHGVRAAVAALMLLSVIKMSKKVLCGAVPIILAGSAFLLLVFFDVDAIGMILAAAAAGLVIYWISFLKARRSIKK